MMRALLNAVAILFVAAVSAVSTTGNRLLVILNDVTDKDLYSKFLGDLKSEFVVLIGALLMPLPHAIAMRNKNTDTEIADWRLVCSTRVRYHVRDASQRRTVALPPRREDVRPSSFPAGQGQR